MKNPKTFEDYKLILSDTPSQRIREKLLAEADERGFTAWQMAELAGVRAENWA